MRNLAQSGKMILLDPFEDDMCLWRCIAVHNGARPDRCTQAARELAKSHFQLKNAPINVSETSLDELEKVENHLNRGKKSADWHGVRAYKL